jgi:3',5'-cyclic AMP phosphodiesterase CpdA
VSSLTILHASDLQCGRPFVPRAAEAFVRLAHDVAPDVVVVSGDLTQRAKARQFVMAMELLARLPDVPLVVTPGNHDVPLYRVWERLLAPYRNWRAQVSPDLDSVTRVGGATLVALNSSAPRRAIVNGRVDARQVEWARGALAGEPTERARVLVIHHHFVPVADGQGGRPLPGASELVRSFESMGVDAVLGGHIHQTLVHTSRDLVPGDDGRPGVPLIACGTTTSRRGRGPEVGINSLNVVRIGRHDVEIIPHVLEAEAVDFDPIDPIVLPRPCATDVAEVPTNEGAP